MEVEPIGGTRVVKVIERVDSATCKEVESGLQAVIATNPQRIICDCSTTKYISSAGLRVFLLAAKNLKRAGGQLVLACATSNYVYESFELAGITHVIPVFETVDEAKASPS